MSAIASVEESLFASLEPPRLAGSRCRDCNTVTFPVQSGCPRCAGSSMDVVELPDTGALWTWTVQSFEPKLPYRVPPDGFVPYGVGYVDLGEVIVESRLTGDLDTLQVGTPMQLGLLPMWTDGDTSVVTYSFAAQGAGS